MVDQNVYVGAESAGVSDRTVAGQRALSIHLYTGLCY